jgi:lysophospholipase L1-like esterase
VKRKSTFAASLMLAVLASLALAPARGSSADQNADHWVGTWATSPLLAGAQGPNGAHPPEYKDATLRQIVHVSIGGPSIRVRFSNTFGATPLVISSAHVAVSAGAGAIRPDSDKALTFNGQTSVTIPAGAPAYSDPLDFNLAPLSDLAITIHVDAAPQAITTHQGSSATSYLQSGDAVSSADLSSAMHIPHWYFLEGVDVKSPRAAGAVVTFGDSITDGAFSKQDANSRWPDDLARRLAANKKTSGVGVLNEGIGGNRLLHDIAGPNALARFDRDVLAQSGVRWLVVLEGINDIGYSGDPDVGCEAPGTDVSAAQIIGGYKTMIAAAHEHGIKIFGCTLTPFESSWFWSVAGQAKWQAVNRWIRTSGAFDGVFDFARVLGDPNDPNYLNPAYDSGDGLHPNDAGYSAMADVIHLNRLR